MTILTCIFTFFRTYLVDERGLAVNTVASYAEAIKQFLLFVADKLGCHVHVLDMATLKDDIVREFLDFARGRTPQVAMTDPNEPARRVVELFHDKAGLMGIELKLVLLHP